MSDQLDHLVLRVASSADWRDQKAAQYPDDRRNVRSSHALKTLAKNLEALAPDDAAVEAYEDVMQRALKNVDAVESIIEVEQRYINRYGFDYPQDGNPAPFLEGLTEEAALVVKEADEAAAEEENEAKYQVAKEVAGGAAKEAAHEAAVAAAKEAANEAAEEAYKQTYREVYEETYKEALIATLAK